MRPPIRNRILTLSLLAGMGGGITTPALFILAMIVNSSDDSRTYAILLTVALVGLGVGLVVAACISSFLFWLINRFFNAQQTTLYQLSLFGSPTFSFVMSFLLNGALTIALFSGSIAHG